MNRLIANLSSFITRYKRNDTEGTLVGNIALDTDWTTFVFSWDTDRTNNRTIDSGTTLSSVPNLTGEGTADVVLTSNVTAKAKTKEGRRLYRVTFTESSEKYDMIIDLNNNIIDRRG